MHARGIGRGVKPVWKRFQEGGILPTKARRKGEYKDIEKLRTRRPKLSEAQKSVAMTSAHKGRRVVRAKTTAETVRKMVELGVKLNSARHVKFANYKKKADENWDDAVEIRKLQEEIFMYLPELLAGPNHKFPEDQSTEALTILLEPFAEEEAEGACDLLVKALDVAYSNRDQTGLEVVSDMIESMTMAKFEFLPVWKAVGFAAMLRLSGASQGVVSQLAWSLDTARDGVPAAVFDELKAGMQANRERIVDGDARVLGWACAELGFELPDILGTVSARVQPEVADSAIKAVEQLGSRPGSQMLHFDEVRVVAVPSAVDPAALEELVGLADRQGLWRPTARKGASSDDAGGAVEGWPWSALLSSPEHVDHPASLAVRQWAAEALGQQLDNVESLRIVRYREGEQSGPSRVDVRPDGDASLWVSGQRLATVVLNARTLPEKAGGEMVFDHPQVGLSVSPEAGAALVWPTVAEDGGANLAAARRALPVSGDGAVKFAIVTWVRSGPAPGHGGAPAA